ncbi:hypothetical protein BDU57DRAFT_514753 [Ampelomyces quisqualis]|uniref:Pectate lyase n=1 Tax=Ampelomyces quisqualis TaxID=50730 RepID=A0A6A5QRZ7_AMPQU|nr:hypothetical protein BDU57DRAFT_514753 [Ampelomyces quisqualis]
MLGTANHIYCCVLTNSSSCLLVILFGGHSTSGQWTTNTSVSSSAKGAKAAVMFDGIKCDGTAISETHLSVC